MASPASPRTDRLPALDALRGIAIVLVLGYHFAPQAVPASPGASAVVALLHAGWVGVDLFFVLSGFLITGILLDGRGTQGMWRRFYGRRALRILPLYYATLGFLVLAALGMRRAGTVTEASGSLLRDQTWYWLHGANFAVARDTHWETRSWVQHFWSLAVEEQFYLVWPCIVLLLPARSLPRVIVGTVALAFVARVVLAIGLSEPVAAYVLTLARADALAVGAFLALAWRSAPQRALVTRAASWVLPLMAIALLAIATTQGTSSQGWMMATVGHTYWALLFGAAIWLAIARPGDSVPAWASHWRSWLERRSVLHWMSRYSYGLYVVHYPIREWFASSGLGAADLVLSRGYLAGALASLLLGTLSSLAVAVPLWHLLERPVLDRGNAWLDRLVPRSLRVSSELLK